MQLTVSAILESLRTMADGTLKVSFALNEASEESMTALIRQHRQFGWLMFNPTPDIEVPDEVAVNPKGDNPLQDLNKALWVYWSKTTDKSMPYNMFLRKWIAKKKKEILDIIPKD